MARTRHHMLKTAESSPLRAPTVTPTNNVQRCGYIVFVLLSMFFFSSLFFFFFRPVRMDDSHAEVFNDCPATCALQDPLLLRQGNPVASRFQRARSGGLLMAPNRRGS